MTLEADAIAVRRALRRKLTFWRFITVATFILSVLVLGAVAGSQGQGGIAYRDHIARIRVDGFISNDEKTLELIRGAAKEPHVKAVILRINSPGGTTVASEALYEELARLAGEKPLVAVMDTVAASGGYIAALPAHRIIARGNTVTGSIGVIFQWPDVSRLLDMAGVKVEELKSGDLKAAPSPFSPMNPKVREVSEALVADGHAWFTGLVAKHRKLDAEAVARIADGRVFTGRQALRAGLIDFIGDEDQAKSWLKTFRSIPADLPVLEHKPQGSGLGDGFAVAALRGLFNLAGLGELTAQIEKVLFAERLSLDGMQSVWHPSNLTE